MGNFLKTLNCYVCLLLFFFPVPTLRSPFNFFLQLTWICHVSFLHLCLWHFLILAHTFSGSLGSHTCQSYGKVLLFRITQNSCPVESISGPKVCYSTFWISFFNYTPPSPSLWPPAPISFWKPSQIAQVGLIPLSSVELSFAHFPSILVDTYLSETYNGLGTVQASGCKKIKMIKILTSSSSQSHWRDSEADKWCNCNCDI